MVVLVTCKNEEDLIIDEGPRVFTTLNINFSDAQGQITPESAVVSGRNLNFQAFEHVLVTCKNDEWSQHFSIISLWGFFQTLKGS